MSGADGRVTVAEVARNLAEFKAEVRGDLADIKLGQEKILNGFTNQRVEVERLKDRVASLEEARREQRTKRWQIVVVVVAAVMSTLVALPVSIAAILAR